jgi:acyl carrier protein
VTHLTLTVIPNAFPIHEVTMTRRVLILMVAVVAGCSEQPIPAMPKAVVTDSSSKEVEEFVPKLLAEQLAVDRSKIVMNRPIGEPPLGADELDLVEIIMEIEEHFDVSIPDEDLEEISGAKQDHLLTRITPAHLVTLAKKARERSSKRTK